MTRERCVGRIYPGFPAHSSCRMPGIPYRIPDCSDAGSSIFYTQPLPCSQYAVPMDVLPGNPLPRGEEEHTRQGRVGHARMLGAAVPPKGLPEVPVISRSRRGPRAGRDHNYDNKNINYIYKNRARMKTSYMHIKFKDLVTFFNLKFRVCREKYMGLNFTLMILKNDFKSLKIYMVMLQ